MLQPSKTPKTLLTPRDPQPVETVNAGGRSPFVLTCEHAGRAVPESLGDLGGVAQADMDRHIAWDVGAEGLSRQLSTLLDAPLVLQRYSRLVVDCNRPFEAPDCFPAESDGTPVPANVGLTQSDRRQRFEEIHQPFHHELAQLLDERSASGAASVLVSMHSFTPRLAGGPHRPWHLGVLAHRDRRLADSFLKEFQQRYPDVPSTYNQPYVVDDLTDYTIPVHGEARGIPHLLLEIRNDLIADSEGHEAWAALIAETLAVAHPREKGRSDG